jgi:hypothetical protein
MAQNAFRRRHFVRRQYSPQKRESATMSSNYTLLSIGAFIILTTILNNFYGLLGSTGDDVADAQDMILATAITTSYLEIAQGLAFDEVTDTSSVAIGNPSALTAVSLLGPEDGSEDSVHAFDDFDDFDGLEIEKDATGVDKRFRTRFAVSYVNPANVSQVSVTRTLVKRIDTKTWRVHPPIEGTDTDTLRLSLVLGYFHFD